MQGTIDQRAVHIIYTEYRDNTYVHLMQINHYSPQSLAELPAYFATQKAQTKTRGEISKTHGYLGTTTSDKHPFV